MGGGGPGALGCTIPNSFPGDVRSARLLLACLDPGGHGILLAKRLTSPSYIERPALIPQLLGLASSVALLRTLEAVGQPELVVPAWAAAHGVHVALRYVALRALRFPYPNQVGWGRLGTAPPGGDAG